LGSEGVVATERHTLLVGGAPPSLVSCFAPNPSGAGAESSTTRIGEGGPCPTKQWPHTTTLRRPRAGGEILDREIRREEQTDYSRLLTEDYPPYISAETTRYNTNAHEPINTVPASHTTPTTNATGISKKRS
jgi:hypothetical protein